MDYRAPPNGFKINRLGIVREIGLNLPERAFAVAPDQWVDLRRLYFPIPVYAAAV